jgi:trans-AT polyketide synthase/acyltransferase/oxidoreductase domain-containing protein
LHYEDITRGARAEHEAWLSLGPLNQPLRLGPEHLLVKRGLLLAPSLGGPSGIVPENAWRYLPGVPWLNRQENSFCRLFGVKYPYMAGAMANGIASVEFVKSLHSIGVLGSFGAAGLSLTTIADAIDAIQREASLGKKPQDSMLGSDVCPFAVNLIHSPSEPGHELATAQLLVAKGVQFIEASAYLRLTEAIVFYRAQGLRRLPDGRIETQNKIIAKISRAEVVKQFLMGADRKIVARLLERELISAEQAELLAHVPIADAITIEADSGGHTDNRPAMTLFSSLQPLVKAMAEPYRQALGRDIPVGLAGGLATPQSIHAAFALGAEYVVTGSMNQSCLEAGTSEQVKSFLAEAEPTDVMMAPAADMFEMGVKVQVLKRKTMFPMRAAKLFQLYQSVPSFDELPPDQQEFVETTLLRKPFAQAWQETEAYFMEREPREAQRGRDNPKHRMALVFRSYLGLASRWAIKGLPDRSADYQIWCGPAMGAFNQWAKDSFLERPSERRVDVLALNLLRGAAVMHRLQHAQALGWSVSDWYGPLRPVFLSVAFEQLNGLPSGNE